MERVYIYDTTLRDGAQTEGVSFTVADKLEAVQMLDALGVDYIEGGWPGSNVKDLEFFAKVRDMHLRNSRMVAFTSTRRKNSRIEEDEHMQAVLGTGFKHCAVVGKTWDFHVYDALRTTLDENIAMIRDTIAFLAGHGIEVLFDAEHFFDGFKNNPDYALATLRAAASAGAEWLVLCDTNGGSLPEEVAAAVRTVKAERLAKIGIHAHNDSGLAVANTLVAVNAGATQVQGTINGFGERCGNADLCAVTPNLVFKLGAPTQVGELGLGALREMSARFYEMTAKSPVQNQPYVGRSAFAHKAGIHVSAVVRNPSLYEHVNPALMGNERRVLVSELSGASNVLYQLQELDLPAPREAVANILARVKAAERQGYVYEGAESSLELLMREELGLAEAAYVRMRARLAKSPDGWSAQLAWVARGGRVVAPGQGGGASEGHAFCAAAGLTALGFRLTTEHLVAVALSEERKLYRVHLGGAFLAATVATVGVGETIADAFAEAVLQALAYVEIIEKERSGRVQSSGG